MAVLMNAQRNAECGIPNLENEVQSPWSTVTIPTASEVTTGDLGLTFK